MRLLVATTSPGKLRELAAMVGDRHQLLSLRDLPSVPEVVEDGQTFEENARLKARAYAAASGLAALADDSGLCVDALGGRPGVHSARYAAGPDAARIDKLLAELAAVPDAARGAEFRCAACLVLPNAEERLEVGVCRGRITRAPRGAQGFGYDPVFEIAELGRTFAELTPEEKARYSHRGEALRRLQPYLLSLP